MQPYRLETIYLDFKKLAKLEIFDFLSQILHRPFIHDLRPCGFRKDLSHLDFVV